jgi:hypothetical protein
MRSKPGKCRRKGRGGEREKVNQYIDIFLFFIFKIKYLGIYLRSLKVVRTHDEVALPRLPRQGAILEVENQCVPPYARARAHC